MVFGEDPRQGFFQQATFLHPTLRFRFDFPAGWRTQNSAQQVAGMSAAQDALLVLSGAPGTPQQALSQFLGQQGIQSSGASSTTINGLPAATAQFAVQTEQAMLAGYVTFVQLDGTTYRLLAYTDQSKLGSYDRVFRGAIGSFQRLTDPQSLNVKPNRLRVVQVRSATTLAQFQQQFPSVIPIQQLALINGVDATTGSFPAGAWVKRVVAQ
jgi:predicted Zn-dependent protease